MRKTITRRQFGKSGAVAAAGLAAASAARVLGANERIRLGFIGVGNRGGQVLDDARGALGDSPRQGQERVARADVGAATTERGGGGAGEQDGTHGVGAGCARA